jgi:hypothetical protein
VEQAVVPAQVVGPAVALLVEVATNDGTGIERT